MADVDGVVQPARAGRGDSRRLAVGSAVGVSLGVQQEVNVSGLGLGGLETREVTRQRGYKLGAVGLLDVARVETDAVAVGVGAVEVEDARVLGTDKDNLGNL